MYGSGGAFLRDIALGQIPGLFCSGRDAKQWLLAYVLVYHSPLDKVYALMERRCSPLRLVGIYFSGIDTAGCISNSVEKALRCCPDSPVLAPLLLGTIGGAGGSVWRYLEQLARERREGREGCCARHGGGQNGGQCSGVNDDEDGKGGGSGSEDAERATWELFHPTKSIRQAFLYSVYVCPPPPPPPLMHLPPATVSPPLSSTDLAVSPTDLAVSPPLSSTDLAIR
jgi:hypothetical protein